MSSLKSFYHCGYSATVENNYCLPLRQISADSIQISHYPLPNFAEHSKQTEMNIMVRSKKLIYWIN